MERDLVFGLGALAIFAWLLWPSRSKPSANGSGSRPGVRPDDSATMGAGTGLMGGDIEDAAVSRYALSRTPKDPRTSDARDAGTALGLRNGPPPPLN